MAERDYERRLCAIERMGWDEFVRDARLTEVGQCPDPADPGRRLLVYDIPSTVLYCPVRVLICTNATAERGGTRHAFGLMVSTDCQAHQLRRVSPKRRRLGADVAAHDHCRIGMWEQRCTSQHVICGGGQGVPVGAAVKVFTRQLFRCGVDHRAHGCVRGGEPADIINAAGECRSR